MSRQDALEWCDRNMHSNYPLSDDATCVSRTGEMLPSSLLVDFQLIIDNADLALGTDAEDRFFVSSVYKSRGSLYIELSYLDGIDPVLCGVTGPISLDIGNTAELSERTVRINPVQQELDRHSRLAGLHGRFIIGSCIDMQNIERLDLSFEAGKLLGLRVYDRATDNSESDDVFNITEYLAIKAGDGIKLNMTEEMYNGVKYTVLTIDREEEPDLPYMTSTDIKRLVWNNTQRTVRSINGVSPDEAGNVNIVGGDCVQLDITENGIKFSNPCSKPCCSSSDSGVMQSELSTITIAQQRLEESITNLNGNLTNIEKIANDLLSKVNVDPIIADTDPVLS